MAIRSDDVFEAANAIVADGGKVSVQAVRAKIGSGSFSTIGPYLKEWFSCQSPASITTSPTEPVPQEIVEALVEVAPKIWFVAANLADSLIAAERTSITSERTMLRAELEDSAATGELIAAELEGSQAHISKLIEASAAASITFEALFAEQTSATHVAETRATAAEATITAQAAQLFELQSVAEQLRREQEILTNRAAAAEGSAAAQSSRIADHQATIDQLRNELSNQTDDFKSRMESQTNDFISRINYLDGELARVHTQNSELIKLLTDAAIEKQPI